MTKTLLELLMDSSHYSYEETYESIKSNIINIANDDHPLVDLLILESIRENNQSSNIANNIEYKIKRYEPRLNDTKVIQVNNSYGLVTLKITGAFIYEQNFHSFEVFIDIVL